nr:hypothetical protein [Streptomyces paromomycinus]
MAAMIAGHGYGAHGSAGITGLAPDAKILPVMTDSTETAVTSPGFAELLRYAGQGRLHVLRFGRHRPRREEGQQLRPGKGRTAQEERWCSLPGGFGGPDGLGEPGGLGGPGGRVGFPPQRVGPYQQQPNSYGQQPNPPLRVLRVPYVASACPATEGSSRFAYEGEGRSRGVSGVCVVRPDEW